MNNNSFEHFATKGIQRNLKASRTIEDLSSYYPLTSYQNSSYGGSNSFLAVLLVGIAIGAFFTLLAMGLV